MNISIRYKFLGLILLLVTLVITSIGYFILTQQNQTLRENIYSSAKKELNDLAFFNARAILGGDDLAKNDTIRNTNEMQGLVLAAIWNQDTKEIFPYWFKKLKKKDLYDNKTQKAVRDVSNLHVKPLWKKWRIKKKHGIQVYDDAFPTNKAVNLISFFRPMYDPYNKENKGLIGIMQLSFSDEFIQKAVRKNLYNLLLAGGIFWLIGTLGSLLLAQIIVRPIKILSEGAEQVGSGDLNFKLPELGKDELGRLANQFNDMTEGLKQAQKNKEEQLIIDEQIKQATEIQEGMNPQYFLNQDHYQVKGFTRAAKGVGGDYYDFHKLADGRLAVLISDVSGKSISASLVMVLIKTVVSTYLRLFNSVRGDKIVTTINQVMCGEAHIDKFATFFFCVYNPETKMLDFTNGGHGPILLYRAKNKVCTVSKLEGLPMGIDEDNDYKLAQVTLEPGDLVVLYTDGINEAWDHQKNEFGLARLREKIIDYADQTANDIVARIINDIDTFADGADQHDDMSLVILKIPETN